MIKSRSPSFTLSAEVVESIRDPIALAVYAYVQSLPDESDPPSVNDICCRFQVSRARLKRAFGELDRIGVTS